MASWLCMCVQVDQVGHWRDAVSDFRQKSETWLLFSYFSSISAAHIEPFPTSGDGEFQIDLEILLGKYLLSFFPIFFNAIFLIL